MLKDKKRKNENVDTKLTLKLLRSAKNKVSQFECSITLGKNGLETDGKSILGMMSLAAGKGTQLTVECDGIDAEDAMRAITECIADRFGENE